MAKRKLEGELQTLHADLDEMLNEAKNSEEKVELFLRDFSSFDIMLLHL